MATKIVHFVSHYCGPQECDCSPRCHAREGDEIVTSSSVAAVTCKNCLRGLRKNRHPGLPQSTTIAEERDQLKAECEAMRKAADRYQWLREARSGYIEVVEWIGPHATGMTGEDLDALLDAAMGKGEQS